MVRVRPANVDDLARMMELVRSAPQAAQWSEGHFEKLLMQESGCVRLTLVAEEYDAISREFSRMNANQDRGRRDPEDFAQEAPCAVAGFLAAREAAGEWEIENVVVSAQARRRGLGSKLLGEFLHHARSMGGREVFLEVRESNTAARALYEKWAFFEAGRRKQYYQGPPEDALILKFSFPFRPPEFG